MTEPGTGRTFFLWSGIRLPASHWVHRRVAASIAEAFGPGEEDDEDI